MITTSINLSINSKISLLIHFQYTRFHCEDKPKFYDDHDNIFKLLKDPIYIIRDKANVSLVKELRFLLSHIDKKHNEVVFSKYFDPSCQHCVKNSIKAEEFYSFLKKFSYKLLNPQFSKVHLGHYQSFIEVCQ